MSEKLKDAAMQKIAEDLIAVAEKHNLDGAVFLLEKDGNCQFLNHKLSYQTLKDHLCFATYFNEKGAIEETDSATIEHS